jgi:hypothetical protein
MFSRAQTCFMFGCISISILCALFTIVIAILIFIDGPHVLLYPYTQVP